MAEILRELFRMFYPVDREEQRRWAALLSSPEGPADLDAVRAVYDAISERGVPLAYAFVHQRADGQGTWDIFHMSELIHLAHCKRVSGPGSEREPSAV